MHGRIKARPYASRLDFAGREYGLHECFGNVLGELVAQITAGDLAGLDGHLVLHQVLVAVAALREMEFEMLPALDGKIAADIVEEEFGELPAFHARALPKCGASIVRNA